MTLGLGDVALLFDWLQKIVAAATKYRADVDRHELRGLLANIYFSKESIERIVSASRAEPSIVDLAPKAVLKQLWDTRIMIGEALDGLDRRVDRKQFGLRGQRTIDEVKYAKQAIRKTLTDRCVDAIRDGTRADLDEILNQIRELNSKIEQLDYDIGGIFSK